MNNSDQIKTSLGIKILITFIVYLNLIIIASIIFYIFSKLNSPLEQRWMYDLAESFYMIFIIGIVGVLPTISGASPIFLFPFLPCIITLVITFIIVHLLEINQIITRNKKTFLSIVALCLIGIVILFINDQLVKVRHKIKMEEDMKIYSTEYFSEYPIQSKFRFIYPDKNKIIISDLNGNKKEVLSEISMDEEHATIGYVSPKGTYYMIINPESVRLFDTANNIFKQDLCNQIEFIKDCPISCKWAPDESSFLCQYERYSKKSKKDTRDLVLFDPVSGNHKNIYYQKDAYEIDYIKQYEGFTFVNNNSLIFSGTTSEFSRSIKLIEMTNNIMEN